LKRILRRWVFCCAVQPGRSASCRRPEKKPEPARSGRKATAIRLAAANHSMGHRDARYGSVPAPASESGAKKKGGDLSTATHFRTSRFGGAGPTSATSQSSRPTAGQPDDRMVYSPASPVRGPSASSGSTKYSMSRSNSSSSSLGCGNGGGGGGSSAGILTCR
jgi:hypothetical protein